MNWKDINSPDDLKQWAKEKAATPEALERFWWCMHHLVGEIETVLADSKLEHPMSFGTGTSQVTFHDGRVIYCYLVTFTMEDTKEEYEYLFEMLPNTDQYVDARYAEPGIPATINKIQ